jgi:fatty-acyl-CoA synthase/long-chain acyl-CoA synthetase
LRDVFEKALRVNAPRRAISLGGQVLTYAELDARSRALADGLGALGIRPGDRIGLLTGDRFEYAVGGLATWRAGAVAVPVNPMLPPPTVSYVLNHSGARALVVSGELTGLVRGVRPELEHPIEVIQVNDDGVDLEPGARSLDDVIERGRASAGSEGEVVAGDPAVIAYTGGTTGRPKGVVHSQRSLVANLYANIIEAEIRQEERLLLTTPLSHAAGVFLWAALLRGAQAYVLPRFDPDVVLEAVERDRITWTFAVPTMIYRLLDAGGVETSDLSSLRTIVYGAAPIAPERLRRALEVFGPVFIQLYGQTECPQWITRLAKEEHFGADGGGHLLGSCGRASLMCDVRILDEAGRDVEPDRLGEVCVRAPYTMNRYHDDPQATSQKFAGELMRTGDVGLMDRDGYLFLKDRTADMIISGGMNVYSTAVEAVLYECPAVTQAAVIGVPHPDWGEAVHAVIVSDNPTQQAKDILEFCAGRLAKYEMPKTITFLDELPLTPVGKVDKKALRAPHWSGHDRAIH